VIVEQLIAEFRRVLQDAELPYLWSDDEICLYLTDAVNEACTRASLIEDRTTAAVCAFSTVSNTASYPLHQSVHRIKRVTVDGYPLFETSVEYLDQVMRNWETKTGNPNFYMAEGETKIRLVPTPDDVYSVAMTVYRTPLLDLTTDDTDASPEIHSRFHMQLMPWVYRCALLKQDAETSDKARAAEYEGIFTASFGQRIDANVRRKQRDKRPPVVSMVW